MPGNSIGSPSATLGTAAQPNAAEISSSASSHPVADTTPPTDMRSVAVGFRVVGPSSTGGRHPTGGASVAEPRPPARKFLSEKIGLGIIASGSTLTIPRGIVDMSLEADVMRILLCQRLGLG